MIEYAMIPATEEHAQAMAPEMRQDDVDELWAASHTDPLSALQRSISARGEAYAGLADGEIVVMYGISRPTELSMVGIPWLLGTDRLPKHARKFLRENKQFMAKARANYSHLVNYVDARNKTAIRWLKWLGFTLEPARPYGAEQMPFHRFMMES